MFLPSLIMLLFHFPAYAVKTAVLWRVITTENRGLNGISGKVVVEFRVIYTD